MKFKHVKMTALAVLMVLSSCSDSQEQSQTYIAPVTHSRQMTYEDTQKLLNPHINDVPEIMKGNLYGCDGSLLVYSKADGEGGYKRYFPNDYAVSHANILSELSDGIDAHFNDVLTEKNPTPVNGNENVGQSVVLTIDSAMQNDIYNFMAYNNMEGSVVVMRTDGSIASEVSYPSYDPEYYTDNIHGEDLVNGDYGNKAMAATSPGSCFKIMSEVVADMYGIYSLYDEGTWTDDGATIVNWDHDTNPNYPIQERTLFQAFLNSSNIFFAKAFNSIGYDGVLNTLNNVFHFGLGNDIECDFGTLSNNIEFYCLDDLRRSAFGQSYVRTTPVFLASLAREAVLGDMVRPFVMKEAVDTNNPQIVTQYGSQRYDYIASIPYNYRQNLLDGMLAVANDLGLYAWGDYTVYAKTGTAEIYDGNDWLGDITYITGFICNYYDSSATEPFYDTYDGYSYNGSYSLVLQLTNPEYFDFDFASESSYLYQGLIDIVLSH